MIKRLVKLFRNSEYDAKDIYCFSTSPRRESVNESIKFGIKIKFVEENLEEYFDEDHCADRILSELKTKALELGADCIVSLPGIIVDLYEPYKRELLRHGGIELVKVTGVGVFRNGYFIEWRGVFYKDGKLVKFCHCCKKTEHE